MTEAIRTFLTPVLIFLPHLRDHKEGAATYITQRFGTVAPEQLIWINEENGTFTIEMVRDLIQDLSFASFQGKTRHVVLLGIDQASAPAQNAMLKLLEEPPAATQLWLTAHQTNLVLPTVTSRCEEVFLTDVTNSPKISEAVVALASTVKILSHRELIEIADEHSDREAARQLLTELIYHFHSQSTREPRALTNATLATLLESLKLLDANVNTRLVLEQCFFALKRNQAV